MEYIHRSAGLLSRFMLMVVMMAAAVAAPAQSIVISPTITADKATPITSGTLNALQGSGSISYGISLATNVTEVTAATYTIDGETHPLEYTVADNKVTFSTVPTISFDQAGEHSQLSVSVTFTPQATEGIPSPEERTQTATSEWAVKVWPSASATITSDLPEWGILTGRNITFAVTHQGGYDSGWRFSWGNGNTHTERAENLTTDVKTFHYSYSATNYAPDGTSVWEKVTQSFDVPVFPNPYSQEGAVDHPVVFAGANVKANVIYRSGNPDGWIFNWTGTDDPENHSSTATYTAVNNGTSKVNHQIGVNVVNNAPDGTQWSERNFTYDVTVWPAPSATLQAPDRTEWYDGETVNLAVNTAGGDPARWTYSWTVDGSPAAATGNTLSYVAANNGTAPATRTITVTATNTPAGINEAYSVTRSYTCTVYPTPVLGNFTTDKPVTFSGTAVTMSATATGGNADSWTYKWALDGTPIAGTTPTLTTTPPANTTPTMRNHIYTLTATNTCGDQAKIINHDFEIAVWPAASATLDPSRDRLFNGDLELLTVTPAGGSSSSWTYSWKVDGSNVSNTSSSYQYSAVNTSSQAETHTVTVTATNAPQGIDTPYTVELSRTFTVYPDPAIATAEIDKPVVFTNTAVSAGITTAGGNPDGWTYSWTLNGSPFDSSAPSIRYTPVNNGTTVQRLTFEVTATNSIVYAQESRPDNVKTLRRSFDIDVWPAASSSFNSSTRTQWINGESVNLSITPQGGDPSGWTYTWKLDDRQLDETSSQYTYLAENTGDTPATHTITVTAVNTPEGVDRPYSTTYSYTCTVYPTPALNGTIDKTVIFSGTEVNMTATATGGNPDGWVYSWTLDGTAIAGTEPALTATPPANTGTAAATHTYRLTAVNTCEATVTTLTRDFEVTVWPVPSAAFTKPERTDWLNNEQFSLAVIPSGGDAGAWSYAWTIDGRSYGSTSAAIDHTAVNTGTAAATHTITVRATNAPDGIDAAYIYDQPYTWTDYPDPKLINSTLDKAVTFSGTPVTMSVEAAGGYPDGWTYSWTLDGSTIAGTEPSLTATPPANTGTAAATHTYRVTAVNTCEATVTTLTHDFEVTVWPAPSATFDKPERTDWLNNQQFSLAVIPSGGDSNAWSYTWTLDSHAYDNTTGSVDYTAVNTGNAPATHTITVRATNAPAGIDAAYVFDQTYTWTDYPDPQIINSTLDKDVIFSGTPVTMSVEAIGGYPGSWTYSWTLDGNAIDGTEHALTATPPANTGTAAEAHTYRVTAVNTCDATVTTLTRDFEITVWPAPSATLTGDLPAEAISGDDLGMTVSHVGGDSNSWSYKWSINNSMVQEGTDNAYTYRAVNENENDPVTVEVKVEVTNSPEGIDAPFTATYTHTVMVWPGPTSITIIDNDLTTCDGRSLTLGVRYVGGQSNNWTFSWTRNGEALDNTLPTLPVTFSNNTGAMTTDVYTVTSVNTVEGTERYRSTETYTINIYPAILTTKDQKYTDIYYGGSNTLSVTALGGYPDGWTYEWTDNLNSTPLNTYTAPADDNADSYLKNIRVTVTNSYGDEVWYTDTFDFSFTCWSRGQVTPVSVLDSYYNGNINTTLQTAVKGGYPGGWTYVWYLNGTPQADSEPSLAINEFNYGDDEVEYEWALHATNKLNDETGSTTTVPFTFTLCPVISTPTSFAVSQEHVRNGSTIVLSVVPSAATGGSHLGWNYHWTADGSAIDGNEPVISQVIDLPASGTIGYTDITYGLRLNTADPNETGAYWFDETYPARTVRVYNVPVLPRELTRKGNGTTCTMIALIDLTDTQLSENGYSFVFGYTDSQGTDHAMPATDDRFYRFTSDVYNNSSNTFWVYTRWAYGDGVTVTSARRYLDGHTDDFDGSDFGSAGRGDSAGLDGITVGDDDIYIDSRGFKACLTTAAEATVRIFNAAGNAVYVNRYPEALTFTEKFSDASLTPGVYIVHVNAGDNVKVRKIVIK